MLEPGEEPAQALAPVLPAVGFGQDVPDAALPFQSPLQSQLRAAGQPGCRVFDRERLRIR